MDGSGSNTPLQQAHAKSSNGHGNGTNTTSLNKSLENVIRKAAYKGIEPLRRRYTANSGANSSLNTSSYTQAARKAAASSGTRDESAGITGKSTVGHRKSTLPDSNLHSHSNTSKLVTSKNTNNNSASGTMQQNNSIQVHRDGGSSTL